MSRQLAICLLLMCVVSCAEAWWSSPRQSSRDSWWDSPGWGDSWRDWADSWRTDSWWGDSGWDNYRWDDRGSYWSWPQGWNWHWTKTNCTYNKNESSINCQAVGLNVTCQTASQEDLLPSGQYKIGKMYWNRMDRAYLYPLYPLASDGDYYDYFMKNPDNDVSHMALRSGSGGRDDIEIKNQTCWEDLRRAIDQGTNSRFKVVQYIRRFRKYYLREEYQANLHVL